MISQSEPLAPKEIMVDRKIRTDVYILSIETGGSVTPEKRIPRKKKNMKSLAMSPPRKDPIILGIKKHQSLPPHLARYSTGFRSLLN